MSPGLKSLFLRTESESIRVHWLRVQIAVTMLVLTVCSLAFITNDVLLVRRTLRTSLESVIKVLSANLVSPLVFGDRLEAMKVLSSLTALPDVAEAKILDSKNEIFASFVAHGTDRSLEPGSTLLASETIFHEGVAVGYIEMKMSLRMLRSEYRRYTIIVLGVLFLGLAIAFFLSFHTQRRISAPLTRLLTLTRQISDSRDYSLRLGKAAEEGAPVELVSLSHEFNKMLDQIQIRDAQLEKKVHERTRQLEDAQATLVASSRMSAIGEMAGGMAHEINNPLQIIHGKVYQLRMQAESGRLDIARLSRDTEIIESTVLRIARIIKGLRSFAREGAGDPFEPASVKSLIEETLELCAARLKHHGVDVRVSDDIDENLTVECRPTQIGQVLLNLLNNAYDAIDSLPEKWVKIEVEDRGADVRILVTDSGSGIPESVRKRIMEPFFTTKEVGKGTGLGLSISRGIMERHQGSLAIDPDRANTCFVITIPKQHIESVTAAA